MGKSSVASTYQNTNRSYVLLVVRNHDVRLSIVVKIGNRDRVRKGPGPEHAAVLKRTITVTEQDAHPIAIYGTKTEIVTAIGALLPGHTLKPCASLEPVLQSEPYGSLFFLLFRSQ